MHIFSNAAQTYPTLKILYGHKFQSFLRHLIYFRLNSTQLNNLSIWFSKIFCLVTPIIFGQKPSFKSIIGRKISKTFKQKIFDNYLFKLFNGV